MKNFKNHMPMDANILPDFKNLAWYLHQLAEDLTIPNTNNHYVIIKLHLLHKNQTKTNLVLRSTIKKYKFK